MMQNERKIMPLSNKEYYAFRNLMGMVNNFDAYSGDLKARCGLIEGGWRDMMLKIIYLTKKLKNYLKKKWELNLTKTAIMKY